MKCPHCLSAFHSDPTSLALDTDKQGLWRASHEICPACGRIIVLLVCAGARRTDGGQVPDKSKNKLILAYPRGTGREAISPTVPGDLAEDYTEACTVLSDSPKAAAALARRALQHFLRDYIKVKPSNLDKEIEQVLNSGQFPPSIADGLDAVRQIGNFAAHPIKSTSSGEVVPVEPGEAEWTLDVLESLFDFYFAQPAALKAKRAALDAKLDSSGKPPLKKSP